MLRAKATICFMLGAQHKSPDFGYAAAAGQAKAPPCSFFLDEIILKQYYFYMDFDFDPQKSARNKIKHGIDFKEAFAVWDDENLIVLRSKYLEEERFLAIGRVYNKSWAVVFTQRGDKIRIISARRSRGEEVAYYEENKANQR
ncbi:MAG: BrnT family toxin [Cystobacterineae bacterium]|nr:BrnT family toxin [Cystobacterineae bacterium]